VAAENHGVAGADGRARGVLRERVAVAEGEAPEVAEVLVEFREKEVRASADEQRPADVANCINDADKGDRESIIRELVRANVEMTRTIADRFGGVMQAAAELLRAADGAGLPRREPAREMEDADDDDGPDEDVGEDDDSPNIAALIAQVLPMIQMWLAARTEEKTVVAPPAPASPAIPVAAPATGPAVAGDAMIGERDAAAGQEPATAPGAAEGEDPREVSAGAPSSLQHEVRAGSSTPSPSDGGGRGATRNAARTWLPGLDHLLAIYAELLPAEKRIVQLVVARMSPDVRAQWLGELSRMTVEQAVALLRSMIPQAQSPKARDS
jgi:hypothetical protein